MSRNEMAAPEDYGTRDDEIRRQQSRRENVPQLRVDLNVYSGIGDQIVVGTAQAGALFIP